MPPVPSRVRASVMNRLRPTASPLRAGVRRSFTLPLPCAAQRTKDFVKSSPSTFTTFFSNLDLAISFWSICS